jgi:hypothetical protein
VCGSANHSAKDLIFHGFPAHDVDIFAATVVIDVVQAVRVGESCFIHVEVAADLVHEADELLRVKLDAFVVFS